MDLSVQRESGSLPDDFNDLFIAASAGDSHAQFLLGFHFSVGNIDQKIDLYSAIHWYKEAIKQKNDKAMYGLASLYFSEPPPFKNWRNAIKLMQDAAELGNAQALYFLAVNLIKGAIIQPNYKTALSYLELAASKNHLNALHTLGQFYEKGHFVQADKAKAYALYRIAKDEGHKISETSCTYILFTMTKEEIDQSKTYTRLDEILTWRNFF